MEWTGDRNLLWNRHGNVARRDVFVMLNIIFLEEVSRIIEVARVSVEPMPMKMSRRAGNGGIDKQTVFGKILSTSSQV